MCLPLHFLFNVSLFLSNIIFLVSFFYIPNSLQFLISPIFGSLWSFLFERFFKILSSFVNKQFFSGNLDVFTAITPTSTVAPPTDGYKVENQGVQPNLPNPVPKVAPILNINDLFQKLVASGFVTTTNQPQPQPQPQPAPERSSKKENISDVPQKPQPLPPAAPPTKIRRSVCDYLKPITFDKPETLKVRQSGLYGGLYSGMQCSSCGMRFSPEASMQYSQHLDWHFRQNRKGKRNIRVAASRKWYYSLADWKNYEELEDLEERGNITGSKMKLFFQSVT